MKDGDDLPELLQINGDQSKPVRLSYEPAELWYPVSCWRSMSQGNQSQRAVDLASQAPERSQPERPGRLLCHGGHIER